MSLIPGFLDLYPGVASLQTGTLAYQQAKASAGLCQHADMPKRCRTNHCVRGEVTQEETIFLEKVITSRCMIY